MSERLEAYIPFTVLSKISGTSRKITSFYASSADENSMDKVEAEMTAYLYKRLGDTDSFSVVNASSVMEAMISVTDTMKWMLGGIAAISLLVGCLLPCSRTKLPIYFYFCSRGSNRNNCGYGGIFFAN